MLMEMTPPHAGATLVKLGSRSLTHMVTARTATPSSSSQRSVPSTATVSTLTHITLLSVTSVTQDMVLTCVLSVVITVMNLLVPPVAFHVRSVRTTERSPVPVTSVSER